MSEAEEKTYRKQVEAEIERQVEERVNVRELKKIRYQLEEMNRENAKEHETFRMDKIKNTAIQEITEQRLKKLEDQNFWLMLIDWIAVMVKKKETIIVPVLFGLLAFGKQIWELIQSIWQ